MLTATIIASADTWTQVYQYPTAGRYVSSIIFIHDFSQGPSVLVDVAITPASHGAAQPTNAHRIETSVMLSFGDSLEHAGRVLRPNDRVWVRANQANAINVRVEGVEGNL